MEQGWYLNAAKRNLSALTAWDQDHNSGYKHFCKVYLGDGRGEAAEIEVKKKAQFITDSFRANSLPHEQWNFRLTFWSFSGKEVAL